MTGATPPAICERNTPMSNTTPNTLFESDKPKTITALGVRITLHPQAFDDWHIVEMLADMQDGDNTSPQLLVRFLRTVLGRDQYERAMKELEDEDGRLPVEKVTEFLTALMEGINPNS